MDISVSAINGRQMVDKSGDVPHEEDHVQIMVSWDLVYFLLRGGFEGL